MLAPPMLSRILTHVLSFRQTQLVGRATNVRALTIRCFVLNSLKRIKQTRLHADRAGANFHLALLPALTGRG